LNKSKSISANIQNGNKSERFELLRWIPVHFQIAVQPCVRSQIKTLLMLPQINSTKRKNWSWFGVKVTFEHISFNLLQSFSGDADSLPDTMDSYTDYATDDTNYKIPPPMDAFSNIWANRIIY
jgi:hypothetical protein